jgi:aryl-alcohol dehydrogenase
MQIKAAVATGPGKPFEIRTVELDDPREDEILVRVVGVGVCHTDIVFQQTGANAPPPVLGHEGSGIVEKVGARVTKVAPGDRVAMTFRSCGTCRRCGKGDAAYCETMPLLNYAGMRPDGSKALRCEEENIACRVCMCDEEAWTAREELRWWRRPLGRRSKPRGRAWAQVCSFFSYPMNVEACVEIQ